MYEKLEDNFAVQTVTKRNKTYIPQLKYVSRFLVDAPENTRNAVTERKKYVNIL